MWVGDVEMNARVKTEAGFICGPLIGEYFSWQNDILLLYMALEATGTQTEKKKNLNNGTIFMLLP